MKRIVILGMSALPFLFASCGGSETEGDGTATDSVAVVEDVVVVANYNVDTANTLINWKSFMGTELAHQGGVKTLSGSVEITTTNDTAVITQASLVVDMNSISDADATDKLIGHLKAPDFFDVNKFATTEFTFERHENDSIYGSISIIGKPVAVVAPATVTSEGDNVTIAIGEFKIDFTPLQMPFFIADLKAPVAEQHDPKIGFSATVVGVKAQ